MEQKKNRVILWLCVALSVLWVLFLPHMLRSTNTDIAVFYGPWYEHILTHGRAASIEGSYANYNPPYLYLLSLISLLHLPTIYALKLVQLPGIIAGAALAWSIARKVGATPVRAVLCGWLVAVSPEVMTNTLRWGQCDMLYSACLLLMLRLLLSNRWNWAMIAFGVAVAFKLQAVFISPVLVAMIVTRELPLPSALYAAMAYLGMMCPAWIAGRPAGELLKVYVKQFQSDPRIAWNVANLYALLNHFVDPHVNRMILVDRVGLVLAALCSLALCWWTVQHRTTSGIRLVSVSAFCLILLPFTLPKMHDRYFFLGNLLLVFLAVVDDAFIPPALCAQVAAVLVYRLFFLRTNDQRPHDYVLPALLNTGTVLLLLFRGRVFSERKGSPDYAVADTVTA